MVKNITRTHTVVLSQLMKRNFAALGYCSVQRSVLLQLTGSSKWSQTKDGKLEISKDIYSKRVMWLHTLILAVDREVGQPTQTSNVKEFNLASREMLCSYPEQSKLLANAVYFMSILNYSYCWLSAAVSFQSSLPIRPCLLSLNREKS